MARKKRVPIGTVRPVSVEGGVRRPGGGRTGPVRVIDPPGPGRVYLGSDDPVIDVVGRLWGNPSATPPRPRYQTDERHGRKSITRWVGQEPLEQTIPIKFDGHPDISVEGKIRDLESLAEPVGNDEPPLVRALGPAVRHQGLRWRVTSIEEDEDRAIYADGGGPQVRYVATVTLTQHVKDDELLVLAGGNAKGLRNRRVRVQSGEDSFYDLAKRKLDDRSKARDIVRANPGTRLGQKLKPGQEFRLP